MFLPNSTFNLYACTRLGRKACYLWSSVKLTRKYTLENSLKILYELHNFDFMVGVSDDSFVTFLMHILNISVFQEATPNVIAFQKVNDIS